MGTVHHINQARVARAVRTGGASVAVATRGSDLPLHLRFVEAVRLNVGSGLSPAAPVAFHEDHFEAFLRFGGGEPFWYTVRIPYANVLEVKALDKPPAPRPRGGTRLAA